MQRSPRSSNKAQHLHCSTCKVITVHKVIVNSDSGWVLHPSGYKVFCRQRICANCNIGFTETVESKIASLDKMHEAEKASKILKEKHYSLVSAFKELDAADRRVRSLLYPKTENVSVDQPHHFVTVKMPSSPG